MNPFERQTVYLIKVDAGIDVKKMYADGIRIFLLAIHDTDAKESGFVEVDGRKFPVWGFDSWRSDRADGTRAITKQIDDLPDDAVWLPWAFINTNDDCWKFRQFVLQAYEAQKHKLKRPAGCWNVEKPLDPNQPNGPFVTPQAIIDSADGCDVLFSTTPWAFERVNYSLFPKHWILDTQLFPAENGSSRDPRSCRSRFYKFGFRGKVHFQVGFHGCNPSDFPYPQPGRFTLYPGDGGFYVPFLPRALAPKDIEYLGPFYGPDSGQKFLKRVVWRPSKRAFVKELKRAMHRAGYYDLTSAPDGAYNRPLVEAMKRFQWDMGISPTGNFGLLSWLALRRLGSCVPGEMYAFQA